MILRLIGWSTGRLRVILFLTALLVAGGIYAFIHLQLDAIPDITGVQVQINTAVPALAPEEIEHQVTLPIERAMAGQPGLDETRSLTKTGLSQVTLIYKDGTNQLEARQLVTERLATVRDQLPAGTTPQLAPITTGLGEIYYYTLEWAHPPAGMDEQHQLMELYETQEYVVRPMLRQVEGVAEVNSNGGFEAQYLIEPDIARLTAAGMTMNELGDRIALATQDAGGGVVDRGARQLTVRTDVRVTDVAMIRALPIKFASGVRPLTVGDLATVEIGHAPRQGAATSNGRESVLGTAMMLVGQNSREVARRVDAKMPDVRAAVPRGMIVRPQYDRSELVDRTVGTVKRNLGEGALLVAIVLLAVMGNWRAALIVAGVIPLAFLATVTGMFALGVSGNLMSLGALDFGLIVDGSIVVVENALRLLAERGEEGPLDAGARRDIVAEAAGQVARPVGFGVAIITLVYGPVLSLGGVEGKLFQPMAEAVMLALASALIATFTIVPAVAAWLLRPPQRGAAGRSGVIAWAERRYAPLLERALAHPLALAVGAVVLLGGTIAVFLSMGQQFTPQLDEGAITAMVYKPVGQSLPRSLATEEATERDILRRFPMVTHTFSRIGSSEIATDPMPPNENDLYIFYKPEKDWPQGKGLPTTKDELIAQLQKAETKRAPDQSFEFAQPIQMRFNEMLEGTRADLSVKIFGDDYDVLETLAAQAKQALQGLPGTADVQFETAGRTRTETVSPDRDAMIRLDLDTGQINDAISTGLAGREVGSILEGDHRHAVVVRLSEAQRADPRVALTLPMRVGEQGLVPLGRVARIHVDKTIEPILHDETHRRAALMVNLSTSDIEGYVHKAQAKLGQTLHMPPGYRIEFGGQFHQLEAARARLALVVPAALAMIFVLVWFALGSVRQALIVYTGIPFAITGGVLALWLRDMPFSITAAIGFIALSGIAMLNGLVLVDHIGSLRGDRPLDEAVRHGAHDRLRPVLATALVASIGFLPMAIAHGAGSEVQRPLATVVIGGIITSTALTLLLLPSFYRWLEARADRGKDDAATRA